MEQKKTYPCSLNAAFLSCCPNLLRSYKVSFSFLSKFIKDV